MTPDGEVDETPGLEAEPDVIPDLFQFHDETLDADNVKKAKGEDIYIYIYLY